MRHGMYLNGVMLISSILNFLTAEFDPATICRTSVPAHLCSHGMVSQTAGACFAGELKEDTDGGGRICMNEYTWR